MAGKDRTFNLGMTITAPPEKHQGTATPSVSAEPTPVKRENRKSRRQREKSSQSSVESPVQSPVEGEKSVGFLRRLFTRRGKSRPASSVPAEAHLPSASQHTVPQQQQQRPQTQSQQAVKLAVAPNEAPCPSPRLANRLRPSASASAISPTIPGPGIGETRTTAEVTPGASTATPSSGHVANSGAPQQQKQQLLLTPQNVLGSNQMTRSVSEGTMPSPSVRRIGPHPVILMVKAVKNVREKNIDPTVDLRQVTVRGEGQQDFGMALAGVNPVLIMKITKGGPADAAGLRTNDMIVSVAGKSSTRCTHAEITTLMKKASHAMPHTRSQTDTPPAQVQTQAQLKTATLPVRIGPSPRPSPRTSTSKMQTLPIGNASLVSELKDNLRKSPRPSSAKEHVVKPVPVVINVVSEPEMQDKPTTAVVAADSIGTDAEDGADGAGAIDDDVMKRLEEAADLIADVALADKPEKPPKRRQSEDALVVPSPWETSKKEKPPGSAPSSPSSSRRQITKEMSFEEMAEFSKSAPTTPGTQRKSKLKRSSSSKGSAFIVEHKSGRMVSVAARRSILATGSPDPEQDEDQERKKVQLLDDFEVSTEQTLDLEVALGKASKKLTSRTMSTDSDTAASPEITLTPPHAASPRSSVSELPAKKDSKIADLQQALMTSPGKFSGGYHKPGTSTSLSRPQSPEVLEAPAVVTPSKKTSLPAQPKKEEKRPPQRSKSVKVFGRKSSSSDFDALLPTTGPSLGLQVGHAKRDIARGRSVRKPSRPRSVHSPDEPKGSEDLFVTDVPESPKKDAKDNMRDEQEPKRKQGMWDVNLSSAQPTVGSSEKLSGNSLGVNLVVQTRLQNGSPGRSPSRRVKHVPSADLVAQAQSTLNSSPSNSAARSPGKASPYKRSRSVPMLDSAADDEPITVIDDEPPVAAAAAASATAAATSLPPQSAGVAGLPKRRVKTGRAERLKSQPDEPSAPEEAVDAAPARKLSANPAVGLKPAKTKKPSVEAAPQAVATPDWVALAKAKQKVT
ncbi:neurofilament heavy polypeptide-like isoform X2 [Sycon ciliatum]|uniref:neurofilament heavy polypeptide-like isoform X2 n=1 Tax=Sycon ciliatum TaxID=27933 RepID=UPI0031F6507B